LVQEASIHPALSFGEAKELVAKYRGSACGPKFNARMRVKKFRDFVRSTRGQWISQDMEFARSVLAELLDKLGSHSSAGSVAQKDFAPLLVNPTTAPALRL
jgi:hypothetical protein